MNRREKEPTGRRTEEGRKNPERRIGIKNTKIMNWINKKMNWIKKTRKKDEKNNLIWFISIVIGLTASIVCICLCCSLESTNAVIALVGIVLSFIGIVLSFKSIQISNMGLKVAGGIRDQIALQQREEVTKMIKVINEFKIRLYFGEFENGESHNCVGLFSTNIFGILEVDESIRKNAPDFVTSTLCFAESFSYPFIDQFVTSPNIPIAISEHLQLLDRSFFKETQKPLMGKCVVVDGYDETCSNYRQSKNNCSDWRTLTSHVKQLKESIENWYKNTGINETPNLCGRMVEITPYNFT